MTRSTQIYMPSITLLKAVTLQCLIPTLTPEPNMEVSGYPLYTVSWELRICAIVH